MPNERRRQGRRNHGPRQYLALVKVERRRIHSGVTARRAGDHYRELGSEIQCLLGNRLTIRRLGIDERGPGCAGVAGGCNAHLTATVVPTARRLDDEWTELRGGALHARSIAYFLVRPDGKAGVDEPPL